jgi:two-component system chemotaxis response regulator CheB
MGNESNEPKFIVVAGASAGGLNALAEFVSQLSEDLDAAIFLLLHLSNKGIGDFLIHRFQRHTTMPCHVARNNEPIIKGHIYIAPPDYHLVIKKEKIVLGMGPEENRWRPSINVLFRSAAAAYGEAVIGVILTGMLDDGASGMMAIGKSGGTTLVQDPNEAEFPDMPLSVLNNMTVDYCLPLSQLGFIVYDTIQHKEFKGIKAPPEIEAEAEIAEKAATGIDVIKPLAKGSVYTCPDCGGGLWEIKDGGLHRYRCNIGHAYSESMLLNEQGEHIENTLWVAVRMMEERKDLLKKIGNEEEIKGLGNLATTHFKNAHELEEHIKNLKALLFKNRELNHA